MSGNIENYRSKSYTVHSSRNLFKFRLRFLNLSSLRIIQHVVLHVNGLAIYMYVFLLALLQSRLAVCPTKSTVIYSCQPMLVPIFLPLSLLHVVLF